MTQDASTDSSSPVGLKEAALDSPTFRSSFTHFSEQIDHVEKWLDTLARSIDKASHEIGALESLSNALLMQTMPPSHLSPAVIDHDSTLLVTRRYGECVYEFWNKTISYLRKMEFKMVEPIRLFLQNELQSFKVCANGVVYSTIAFLLCSCDAGNPSKF